MNLHNQNKNIIAIICFYILSFYIYLTAKTYPISPNIPKAQNPGFYPMLLSGLLFLLSTIYLIQIINKVTNKKLKNNKSKAESDIVLSDDEESFWGENSSVTKIYLFVSIIILIAYVFLLNLIGFAFASFIFLVVLSFMLISNKRKIYQIIIYSLIITLIMFIIFDIFVGIRFPKGLLF